MQIMPIVLSVLSMLKRAGGGLHRAVVALVVAALLLASFAAHAEDRASADRSTPRRAMAAFLEAAEGGDYPRAAEALDLSQIPVDQRPARGAELAEMLHHVLDRTMWIDPWTLSDAPEGNPADGPTERVGSVRIQRSEVPILLTRADAGDRAWSISAATVAAIPRMYAEYGPLFMESHAPRSLGLRVATLALWQWLGLVFAVVLAAVVGRLATFLVVRVLDYVTRHTKATWDDQLLEALRRPSRFFFGVLALQLLLGPLALSAAATNVMTHVMAIVTIAVVAWTVGRLITVLSLVLEQRAKNTAIEALRDDQPRESELVLQADLRVRGLATQLRVLRRVIHVAVAVVALALILTRFEVVRSVGVSLLASAGLAGIVIGFAAQRTFGTLVAGVQLSATQPIRLGDTVVIEGQQGTIEEITLTYVVIKVWDERRLIVPMTRFLEHPFENWTKGAIELHGTVFLNVDWTLPIADLRAELDRILDCNAEWDRRTKRVQVTDAKERVLEVRILVSASNADRLFRLRVDVRERLVRWLQEYEGGRYLPRVRIESSGGDPGDPRDRRLPVGASLAGATETLIAGPR
jgi:small-conductance mechanosensitive channel